MDIFICQYCALEKFSKKSLVGHQVYCKNNPNRKTNTDNTGRKQDRKITNVSVDEYCSYGCGKRAKYKNKSGSYMCETSPNKCSENKLKNSKSTKLVYENGDRKSQKELYKSLPAETKKKMAWASGLTKKTDLRIEKAANNSIGKRKITDEQRLEKIEYYERCQFHINEIIEKIEGFSSLELYGMYNRKTNKGGVVRDHIVSKNYGFVNGIDPNIISHPANCRFIPHMDNAKKSSSCGMSVDELLIKIDQWNDKQKV